MREHSKTSHKLVKVLGLAEKVSQVTCAGKYCDSLLYSEKKVKMFLMENV